MSLDKAAAKELELFIDNDGDLYRQQTTPILKNLATKMAKGVYNKDLAVKLWMYLMDSGAKKYAKMESGDEASWNRTFSVETRKEVARLFNEAFLTEYSLGNYNHLLPKKYQPKK